MEEIQYIGLSCLILLSFLLFKEFRRTNRSRLVWRLLSTVAAVAAFALLLIPIRYQKQVKQAANEINLITAGFPVDSISTLKGKSYVLESAGMENLKYKSVQKIASLAYFIQSTPALKTIQVYGYGLNNNELQALGNQQLQFHPSTSPTGVIACHWSSQISPTTALQVQGAYQNMGKEPVELVLYGLGKRLDSASIRAQTTLNFSFNHYPKQSGKAVYELLAIRGSDTLSRESIPFEMQAQKPIRILMLSSFPDFEYKFLKKWLYENQYPLAFRSQISKNKFSTDFLNLPAFDATTISTSILKKFDVLIVDEEELTGLNPAEQSAISEALNGGMGILIRASGLKSTGKISGRFNRYETTVPAKQIQLRLENDSKALAILPAEQKLFLNSGLQEQVLASNLSGKILVSSELYGQGKLALSTLPATYYWMLEGKKTDYSTFWSTLLSKISRKHITTDGVQTDPAFPIVNEQLRIQYDQEDLKKKPALTFEEAVLSWRQNMEIPFRWDAKTWPVQAGWAILKSAQAEHSIFIYSKSDWSALNGQAKMESTQHYVKNQLQVKSKNIEINETGTFEVSKWWFFAIFLIAASFLWYESRMLKGN